MAKNLHLSDHDLINLFKEGDESAFKVIYERYWQLLFVAACKILKDQDEAKDLVQDVFTSFYRKGSALAVDLSVSSYLYTAIRYKVFDVLSRKKVRESHQESLTSYMNARNNEADSELIVKEIANSIEREIQNLPEKMKIVFELSRTGQLTHKEIATSLNISDKTVKKQINNALKILKPKFINYYLWIWLMLSSLF